MVDEEDVVQPQALYNKNTEFIEGQVRVRRGFARIWNPNKIIVTMYNWVQQQYNRLLYLTTQGNLISRDLASLTESTVITGLSAVGATFAQAGVRIYMAFFDTGGVGTNAAQVWDGTFNGGTPNVDPVFPGPLLTTQLTGGASWGSFSEPGTGSVTKGQHQFAIVFGTWNGAQTPPGPWDPSSGILVPAKFTSAGGQNLQVQVGPSSTWPNNIYTLQLAMTTVGNPNRWFLVPSTSGGGPFIVGRGSSFAVTFVIDIDDVTLTGGGPTEITDTLFNLFVNGAIAQGGITCMPHCILEYGNRIVYIWREPGPTGSGVAGSAFVSDINNPQYVIPAQNELTLPGDRDIVTGFTLGGTLYLCGPNWTYAFTDNLQTPVNWAPCRQVSGDIGSPFIRGVTANPSRGRAWVCDHSGLYALSGASYMTNASLGAVPASYWQKPDWDRINFSAPANALCVKEYPEFRLVVVRAPLDGATVANYLMAWDYTDGFTPDKIKYCGLWNLADYPGIGDIEIVMNQTTKIKELWISRGDANGDVRRMKSVEAGDATDANPTALYDDQGSGIDAQYKLLAVSRVADGPQMQVGGRFRIRGVGPINLTAYSFDQQRIRPLQAITAADLSPIINTNGEVSGLQPGQRFDRFMDEQSEAISYQVDNGALPGVYFYWAAARFYYLPWVDQRD